MTILCAVLMSLYSLSFSHFSVSLNFFPMLNSYSARFFYPPISVHSFTHFPNPSFYYFHFRFFCLLFNSIFLSLCSFYFDFTKLRSSIPQAELHTAWLAVSHHHREQIAFRIVLLSYTSTEQRHATSQWNNGRCKWDVNWCCRL